ncbi:hypothetical protein [Herbaspirillum seropedicae]|uniref:hypothetical protein n=1 Tax=Herbaspirillum seropedicae TaxID=964 RepID=UPI002855A7BF|nr:hypothetical protein [Herbaspirillum seropedicae]MDR6394644.1 hypothetical protein [Herbaspirillum seropedicae]
MKLVVVTLPFPNPKLNPNRSKGLHWSATSGLRKKAHLEGYVLAKDAANRAKWTPTGDDIALRITFEMPDRRPRDRDNLLAAMKCSLDGIAEALGVDDNQFDPVVLRRRFGRGVGAVHVEIGGDA